MRFSHFVPRSLRPANPSARPTKLRRRLAIETLEARVVPSLTATLLDLGGGASELRLSGPTGSSINIDGGWQDNPDANHQHVYSASGDLILKSAQADLPFSEDVSTPLTISTASDSNQLAGVSWSGPALGTGLDALTGFNSTFGVTLNAPATSWNVQQGSDLVANGIPVNPDLPYITFQEDSSSGYTAQFGNTTGSGNLAVAFAPQDPLLYLQAGALTFGSSFGGNLVLQPVAGQQGFVDPVAGHLYSTGNVDLGQNNLTLQNAAMVVNLDAQGDGALLGSLSGDTASQLFNGSIPLSGFGGANQADVAAGFNAQATLTYNALGFNLPLTVTSSSGEYANGTVTVHGVQGVSLFGQTPLAFIGGDSVDVAATFGASGLSGIQMTVANASLGNVGVGNAAVSLTPSSVTLSGTLSGVLGSGSVALTGTVGSDGTWSVQGTAGDLTVGPVTLHSTSVTVGSNGISVSANADVPVLGSVSLAGSYTDASHYSLAAHLAGPIPIGAFSLSNGDVTLANAGSGVSLGFQADATLPSPVGRVHLAGTIRGASDFNLTAQVDSVPIAGFTLRNDNVTLSNTGLAFDGTVTGVQLVGSVHFAGQIMTSGFSLSATVTNIDVIPGVVHFDTASLTLTSSSLTLRTNVPNVPVVGTLSFAGTINVSGSVTLSATAPHFRLLGFIDVDNAMVTVGFPNPRLTVSADLSLVGMVHARVVGTITVGSHFSFDGGADITVAGFTLGHADLHLGNNPGDPTTIHIGPFTTPDDFPVVGKVTLEGSCGPRNGQFSFDIDASPNPPIPLGPIQVTRFHLGLHTDGLGGGSLTLGAGFGYVLPGGIVSLTGYAQVTVSTNGDFRLLANVDASVFNFPVGHGILTLNKTGGTFDMTLDTTLNLIIATGSLRGNIDFIHGRFALHGVVSVDGPLSTIFIGGAIFDVDNLGVRFAGQLHGPFNLIQITFSGAINSDASWHLDGTGATHLGPFASSITVHGGGRRNGSGYTVDFSAAFHVGIDYRFSIGTPIATGNFRVYAAVDGNVALTIGGGQLNISGHLGFTAGIDYQITSGPFSWSGTVYVDTSVDFDNHNLWINLPRIHLVLWDWNLPRLHFVF
jgi:hypothetical protein